MYRNLYIFNTVFLNLVALCTGAWWSRWLTLSRASSWAASRCARGWTQSWTRSGGSTTPSHTSSTPSPGTGCCCYCFQHTFVNYEPALWIPIPITDPFIILTHYGSGSEILVLDDFTFFESSLLFPTGKSSATST